MADRQLESQGGRGNERSRKRLPPGIREATDVTNGDSGASNGGQWKRRRRVDGSPQGGEPRQQRWLVWLLLGVVLPALGGGFLWAAAGYFRCESDAFRRALADHLSQRFGFKVHVSPIEVQGLNLTARTLSLSRGAGVVRYVEFRDLQATVAPKSFFGGDWEILQLRVDQADVHFASADPATGGEKNIEGGGEGEVKGVGLGFGLDANPGNGLLEAFQVRSLNLFWNEVDGKDSWVRRCRLTSANFSKDGKVRISGGAASAWGSPTLAVDFAELQFKDREAQIVRARLREDGDAAGGAGVVEMSGSADWGDDESIAMEIAVRRFNIDHVVSDWWRGRLGGQLNADLIVDGPLRSGGGGVAKGEFTIAEGWVKRLPVLDAFAESLRDSRFRHIEIGEEFRGAVTLSRGGIAIDDLELESDGLIRATGSVGWRASGVLSGELEIGVPVTLLERDGLGRPPFFSEPEKGYCRARLVASGWLDVPRENLSEVILAQMSTQGGEPPVVKYEAPDGGEAVPPAKANSEKERIEKLFRSLLE